MSAYADRRELEVRFGEREIRDLAPLPAGAVDYIFVEAEMGYRLVDADNQALANQADPVIAAAVTDAAAVINASLAKAYDLPLADTAPGVYPTLTRIAADLARRRLYTDDTPEPVAERASQSRADLEALAAGALEIVDTAGEAVPRRALADYRGRSQEFDRAAEGSGRLAGLDQY